MAAMECVRNSLASDSDEYAVFSADMLFLGIGIVVHSSIEGPSHAHIVFGTTDDLTPSSTWLTYDRGKFDEEGSGV